MQWNNYIAATTRSTFTKHTGHMYNRRGASPKLHPESSVQIVHPRDRIKWWNIVPGDKVRIRGDKTSTLQEVYSVNKVANHVFLRGIKIVMHFYLLSRAISPLTQSEDRRDLKPFNYNHVQLFIDHFEFPPKSGSDKPEIVPCATLPIVQVYLDAPLPPVSLSADGK